ncbi:hypothetical protein EYZ11_008842 [Aspergillus tanneri]|uniref:Uncharacterized protein n=1 Tax=Aspergillus tanneri TaxID=1220188 RepID=A0A4S3JBL2_9EURO|nr:hypothetical protein EYZ11_008842 [Aspergillus tanneri]
MCNAVGNLYAASLAYKSALRDPSAPWRESTKASET